MLLGRIGMFSSFSEQSAIEVNEFLTENIFTNFSAREVPLSERVRFGNPPILGLEYVLYFGEISLGVTPRFSFFKELIAMLMTISLRILKEI